MAKKSILLTLIFSLFCFLFGAKIFFYSEKILEEMSEISFSEFVRPENPPKFLKIIEDVKGEFIKAEKDFIEANLNEMAVRVFRGGAAVKEVPILAKGDPQSWGGSAAGIYEILSGNRLSFSNITEVYMPYALHYFGKYYIHGEPYYPGGEKLDSIFSGGCLRLKNEDAKAIYDLSDLNMPLVVIDKPRDGYKYEKKDQSLPEVSSKSFLVADLDTGEVLLEKKSKELFPIASLTKLMTALVVTETVNLERSIFLNEKMLERGHGSTLGMEVLESFRVVELLYPLLIESSNDAAEALASFLGRDKTIELMNEKARSILMENTKFACPSGFSLENVSTAEDLFQLARYITNNRNLIWEITKGKRVTSFGEVSFDIDKLWNKNIFTADPSLIGAKTGIVEKPNSCAVFLFELKGRKVVFILLNSDNLKSDTHELYSWVIKSFF